MRPFDAWSRKDMKHEMKHEQPNEIEAGNSNNQQGSSHPAILRVAATG